MIRYKTGDLLAEEAEALVNTVNCVGVMGRGIASSSRRPSPRTSVSMRTRASNGRCSQAGCVFETGLLTNPRYIINFPTKRHWRDESRVEDIEAGLLALVGLIRQRGIRSIAVPPLGCGLGGLDWLEVRPRIEGAFRCVDDLDVVVFEPEGAISPI